MASPPAFAAIAHLPSKRMRTLPLVLALAGVASVLSAQTSDASILLEVDTTPPEEDELPGSTWVPAQGLSGPPGALSHFRIRVTGTEGGWYRPSLDVVVFNESTFLGNEWIYAGEEAQTTELEWYGCKLPSVDPDHPIFRELTVQRRVDLALLGGTSGPRVEAVRDWCQPLLTQSADPGFNDSQRIWRVDSPLWAATPAGQVHRSLWEEMLRDRETGLPGRSFTALSGGTALHFAVLQQSIVMNQGSALPAITLLNSSAWTDAVEDHHVGFGVQAIAVRAFNLPTGQYPWLDDEDVPNLGTFVVGSEPRLGSSQSSRWVIAFSEDATKGVHNLVGVTLQPGQRHSFRHEFGTYPVMVRFRSTTGGTVTTQAYWDPGLPQQVGPVHPVRAGDRG